MESARCMNKAVFGHVNLYNHQCNNTAIRLQRYTTEHIVPQLAAGKDVSKPVHQETTSRSLPHSLAEISKPVPFNTHQLVCRLQSKGILSGHVVCQQSLYSAHMMSCDVLGCTLMLT